MGKPDFADYLYRPGYRNFYVTSTSRYLITDRHLKILQMSRLASEWLYSKGLGHSDLLVDILDLPQSLLDDLRQGKEINGDEICLQIASRSVRLRIQSIGDWYQLQLIEGMPADQDIDYKRAIDVTTNAIIIIFPCYEVSGQVSNFVFQYGNPAYLRYKGMQECIGQRVFHENDIRQNSHFEVFCEVLQSGEMRSYEFAYPFEGKTLYFAARVMKFGAGLLIASENITDRKQAFLDAQRNTEFVHSVFDTNLIQMSALKAVRDPETGEIADFEITLANKELIRETGRTDLLGKRYLEEYPGVRQTRIFEQMVQVVQTGVPIQDEYYYPYEGFNKWYTSMFVKFHDGVVASNLDITQRKRAEEELYKNFSLLQYAEEMAHSGSWEYDIAKGVFTWSAGMYELFGIQPGAAIRPSVLLRSVVKTDRPQAIDFVQNLRAGHRDTDHVFQVGSRGHIRHLRVSSRVDRNHKGSPIKVLGIVMDISAALKAERELRELNAMLQEQNRTLETKNNELASFAFIASHDLKEPLRKIMFFSNLLRTNTEIATMSVKGKTYLERMELAARRMSFLIDDVLALSRLQVYKEQSEWVDVQQVLTEVQSEWDDEIQRLHAEITVGEMPRMYSSKKYLRYLFNNLLGNALKFHAEGRVPKISIQSATAYHSFDGLEPRLYTVLRVADNGIGFDPEFSDKIFRIFERLHTQEEYPGSGIGLSICRKIMENLGGYITASGVPGAGAEFACFFPAVDLPR